MVPRDNEITQRTADQVAAKLQALYDSSPEEEKRVLETILASVAEPADVNPAHAGRQVSLQVTGIRQVAGTPRPTRIRIPLPNVPRGIIIIC